jgi:hypothetical protein
METAIEPTVTYGVAIPYDAHVVQAHPGWSADSTQWTGQDTIEAGKGDGWNTIRIAAAQDPDGHVMAEDIFWTFFIDTTPPSSQASSPRYSGSQHFPVSWSGADPPPASGLATYNVSVLVDGLFPSIWLSGTTDTAAVYTGSNNHYYSFYTVATDSAGNQESAPIAQDCTTWVDTQAPAVPLLKAPPNGFVSGDQTPTLSWSHVSKGTEASGRSAETSRQGTSTPITYQLQVSVNAGCVDPLVDTTGLADTAYTFVSLLIDDQYFWRVQAADMAGNLSGFQPSAASFWVDTQSPLISATTQWPDTSFGGPFPVTANIGDPAGIGQVLLWYRTGTDTLWRADTMTVAKTLYQGALPEQTSPNTLVEYYVYAEDGAIPPNHQTDPVGAPATVLSFTAWTTGIPDQESFTGVPETFALYQNYPNPFNAGTEVLYTLPEPCRVRLEIYNIKGQKIITLADGYQRAGYHTVYWDGRDRFGQPVASGVYLYRLGTEHFRQFRKMVLLR